MAELKIAWATHEAAEYACKNWHYSKCLPSGKLVKIGVWEDGIYIGVVIFSRGASPHLLSKYDLTQYEGCELTRVALTSHKTPVSRIMAIALKFLRKQSPGLRIAVSFADPEQGHHGGIYQATNWIYTGTSGVTVEYFVRGKWRHVRGAYALVKGALDRWPTREREGKHRYVFPLDETIREKLQSMSKPYPKRKEDKDALKAEASMRPRSTREKGGSSPTLALQKSPAAHLKRDLKGKVKNG
jgi:hypothetical protein